MILSSIQLSLFALSLLLSPLLYFGYGRVTLRVFLSNVLAPADVGLLDELTEVNNGRLLLAYFVLGLVVQLWLMFGLAMVLAYLPGVRPLRAAFVISYLPVLFCLRDCLAFFRLVVVRPSVFFVLWFVLHLALGVSLFQAIDVIQTPWVNNYGDLTFHIGMITSFVFGDNFPPEYQIFPGKTLSYYFFTNLWTAGLWSIQPTWWNLQIVFVAQWVMVWTVVYYALRGNKYILLPWTMLLGGGAYLIVWRYLQSPGIDWQKFSGVGPYAHELIGRDYPWTPFITTIWVTQRPAMLGAAAFLVVLGLFHQAWFRQNEALDSTQRVMRDRAYLFAALLCGLSPLVHTQFFLVVSLYIFLLCASLVISSQRAKWQESLRPLSLSLIGFIPFCLSLRWLLEKGSVARFSAGWMGKLHSEAQVSLAEFGSMYFAQLVKVWSENALPWVCSVAFLLVLGGKMLRPLVVLVFLFLVANLVQLAQWNWDQLKIFLAIYFITISLWQAVEDGFTPRQVRLAFWAHFFLVGLCIPAVYELIISAKQYSRHEVYSKERMEIAERIRELTPPGAIIVGRPDHNSLVTLTGRRLYSGYEGTLSSHDLDYGARHENQKSLEWIANCFTTNNSKDPCPEYLLYTSQEQEFWAGQPLPGPPRVNPTAITQLYSLGR